MWFPALVLVCAVNSGHGVITFRNSQPLVTAPVGTVAGLEELYTADGQTRTVTKFLGIPYAESTTGLNRFRKPVAKATFTAIYDATSYPPMCLQSNIPGLSSIMKHNISQSEDCLTLNIYIPESYRSASTKMYPVIIWIHGGGFTVGTSSLYSFEPLSLLGDVVIVAMNYRIGEFGLLRSADGQAVGNQGLWDQHLAIQWVNRNIASFHGNPAEVTLAGESAGGTSGVLQAMYAGNKGLFKRVIAESGYAFAKFTIDLQPNVDHLVKVAGCDHSGVDAIACLRALTGEQLHAIVEKPEFRAVPFRFQPYVDGDFLVEAPYDIVYGNNSISAAARDLFASIDFLSGANSKDGGVNLATLWATMLGQTDVNKLQFSRGQFQMFVAPITVQSIYEKDTQIDANSRTAITKAFIFEYTDWSDPNDNNKGIEMLIKLSSDILFYVPAVQLANVHSSFQRGKTYFFEFCANPTTHRIPLPTFINGANHNDEIQFLEGQPLDPSITQRFTTEEADLSRAMITMWSNFAKTGDPNMPASISQFLPTPWPAYDVTNQAYLQIDYNMTHNSVKHRFSARSVAFLSQLIPEIIKVTATSLHPFDPSVGIVG